MIITKTPFRISFFGGGTDYPAWYRKHGGAVLATTIDKYCYISCRYLPPFFDHKHRIVYSKIENVREINQIEHPAVRGIFQWANIVEGLEVHHDGDLPARSGLGSSSAFTVGLIKAIAGLRGQIIGKDELAKKAIFIEQDLLNESVGSQDQISASFGGLNKITFNQNDSYTVESIILPIQRKQELNSHLMLFFTGISRIADTVAKSKIDNFHIKRVELETIYRMVDEAVHLLTNQSVPISEFGKLLDESWRIKRTISKKVSNDLIDQIYDEALSAGAIGGKLLGAGGGGFILLFAKPDKHSYIRKRLSKLVNVTFNFEEGGSRVAFYQPEGL